MNNPLLISLKAGELIFLNGAAVRVDRKVVLEFLNDITFILEQHILREEDATTPLRKLYFIVQMIFLSPSKKDSSIEIFKKYIISLLDFSHNKPIILALKHIELLVISGRFFDALKAIRALYLIENIDPKSNELFVSTFKYINQEIESWKLIHKLILYQ